MRKKNQSVPSILPRTINENPNEKIMELALALNDDIVIVILTLLRPAVDLRICKRIENPNHSF